MAPPPGYVWVPAGHPPPPGYAAGPYPGYGVPPLVVKPPAVAPNGMPLAEFGERLGAYIIDALIMGFASMLLAAPVVTWFVIWAISQLRDGGPPSGALFLGYFGMLALILLVGFGVRYLYEVTYLMRHEGRTIGKRAMKLTIVRSRDGGPIDVRQARKRWLILSVASVVGVMSWLDGLWQLWDQPYRQCLHDKFAETIVVKVTG